MPVHKKLLDLLNLVEWKKPLTMLDQARYYQMAIYAEGACGWADRLKTQLAAGMLVLLQDTPCHEFFLPLFRPYEHYLPIKRNFSDLENIVAWAALIEPETAHGIAINARKTAERLLKREAWNAYFLAVLKNYQKLQDYEIRKRPGFQRFIRQTKCPNRRNGQCDDFSSFKV